MRNDKANMNYSHGEGHKTFGFKSPQRALEQPFSPFLLLASFLNLVNADTQAKRGTVSGPKSSGTKMRAPDRIPGALGARPIGFHLIDLP